jgi:hypothetical protein
VFTFKKGGAALAICAGVLTMSGPMAHAAVRPNLVPNGYHLAYSGQYNAAPGVQTHGAATCPGKTIPASGGLFNESAGFAAAIDSSYPLGHNWEVDFDNQSTAYSGFVVYAVCLAPNAAHRVMIGQQDTAAVGTQGSGYESCPVGTKVTGGGAVAFTGSPQVAINDSYPIANGWHVDMDNNSNVSAAFRVYAVCNPAPINYSIHNTTLVSNPVGATTSISAGCTGGATNVAIGGGLYSVAGNPAVQMYASFPDSSGGWTSYEQNNASYDTLMRGYVICAGV